MQKVSVILLSALLPLALFSCAPEAGEDEVPETPGERPPEEAARAPGAVGAALGVDTLEGVGAYLTDADGRALYLFTADTAGRSTCYDQCARAWPPLLARGEIPTAEADPVREAMIDTIRRRTGEAQVTYNDQPLYYFQQDRGPGEVSGQDMQGFGGEWYLVLPEGRKLESEEEGGGR